MASQKKEYRFKLGTIREKKPGEWIVVEDTHEPLIDRQSFDTVQEKLKSRQRPGECGRRIAGRDACPTQWVASAPTGRFCVALTQQSHGTFLHITSLSALRADVAEIYPAFALRP